MVTYTPVTNLKWLGYWLWFATVRQSFLSGLHSYVHLPQLTFSGRPVLVFGPMFVAVLATISGGLTLLNACPLRTTGWVLEV